MNIARLSKSTSGRLVKNLDGQWAFVPAPLPPRIEYTSKLVNLIADAHKVLGALDGMGRTLPNPDLLVMPYMRREAVSSSGIEGTQASLSDLFRFEAARTNSPEDSDVREVHNYVTAMRHGLQRLKELPLSLRLVRELHLKLMRGVRGQEQQPGEFRRRQNWVGPEKCRIQDSIYVPPPVEELDRTLTEWEAFLHAPEALPPLIKCAAVHAQFESIHPFLDGNGRVGRLLITLFLCEKGHLTLPLLYLSGYLEKNRGEYYGRLQSIREEGDWQGWIEFFLEAVLVQSHEAIQCADRILQLKEKYREILQKGAKRTTVSVLALVDSLFLNPYLRTSDAVGRMKVSIPTAQAAIDKLQSHGIVREITGRSRYRWYLAGELLDAIENQTPRLMIAPTSSPPPSGQSRAVAPA